MILEGFLLWGDVGGGEGGLCVCFLGFLPIDRKTPLRCVRTLPHTGQWLLFVSLKCLIKRAEPIADKISRKNREVSFESVKTFKIRSVNTENPCHSVRSQV